MFHVTKGYETFKSCDEMLQFVCKFLKQNADVLLIEWQSHRPEVTNGDLVNHFLWSWAFKTLHCVLHSLLGFDQILHLRGEQVLHTKGITEPAGHTSAFSACLSEGNYLPSSYFAKMNTVLVSHGELAGLLFVAGCQLILDAGHQIVVIGAADCSLNNIQPPGRVQLDLDKESCVIFYFFYLISFII